MSNPDPTKPKLVSVPKPSRPSEAEALAAVRTLLAWTGDDPDRPGLIDTPKRVVNAYREWFRGYDEDPVAHLSKTFEDLTGYDDMVVLRDIDIESHCEHHIAPFLGTAWVAYLPAEKVVGISKLVKVVETYARRLQSQEKLTSEITECIEEALKPRGVAVMIDAQHQCMSTRGVHHPDVSTITTQFTGEFKSNPSLQDRFLRVIGK
jgi:GTP cyclohydrolase I